MAKITVGVDRNLFLNVHHCIAMGVWGAFLKQPAPCLVKHTKNIIHNKKFKKKISQMNHK
jgi:hypothetical protein